MDIPMFSVIDNGIGIYDVESFTWNVITLQTNNSEIVNNLINECNQHLSHCLLSVKYDIFYEDFVT